MELAGQIKQYIQKNNLISFGDIVMVGISGGPDSVALIHILNEIKHELGINLHLAHYNHQLRKGSHADEKFVKDLSEKLNLPCTIDCWKESKEGINGSIEELARERRFSFFVKLAKKIQANCIALAHSQDDLAETVLMRIIRGTGLQGMRSILPKRMIQNHVFIRPLLETKKKELHQYLKKKNLLFRHDPTNNQTQFFRNKIRLQLIPIIEKDYNKNIKEILSSLSKNISTDYDYLTKQALKSFKRLQEPSASEGEVVFDLEKIKKQHPSMQRMLFRFAIESLKGNINRFMHKHADEIEDLMINKPLGSKVNLPSRIIVIKKGNSLFFRIDK